jgi:hypothetical protein
MLAGMTSSLRSLFGLAAVLVGIPVAACGSGTSAGTAATSTTAAAANTGGLPQGSEPVHLDPADFVATIDNPYWSMTPGAQWVYREETEDGEQRVEVTVTGDTKEILGIKAAVIHDVVSQDGEIIEDTLDWYAQDRAGNIWYLGEDTKEYENGVVKSTEGSWTAGVDDAQPGVIMPADPQPGMTYRQEYLKGQAEDAAEVLSLTESAKVPFGSFDQALETKDYTALDPDATENKFYVKGVGPILTVGVKDGAREELVEYTPGR